MKQQISLWILLALTIITPALANPAVAVQADTTTPADSVSKKGWWTLGLETANNSSFYGRNTPTRYPYAAATVTYTHRTGLWASATTYQLFNTEDYIDETDVSVGYSFSMGKRATGTLSYSRFFFSDNTPLVKAVTSNAATAYTTLDWKYILTGLKTSYVFGGSNDLFVVLENSRYIPLNPIWKGKTIVGLDPKISITSGTQEFSETHTTEQKKKIIGNPTTGGGILDPLIPGKGGNNNNNGGTTTTTTTTTTTEHKFKVLNYDFQVPLVVYLGSFEVEPSWRYSIPVNLLEGDESKAQSFYTLNISYTF